MKRILGILLLLVVLLDGPHPKVERPARAATLNVGPKPIWVPIELAARGYGQLRLFGVWELTSDDRSFGGISSLLVRSDNNFTALSDAAVKFDFGVGISAGDAQLAPLPSPPARTGLDWQQVDTESLTTDPVSGKLWAAYEDGASICRFSANFAEVEGCRESPDIAKWSAQRGAESLVRFADGRFLAIEEGRTGADGRHDVLLWAGDPVDRRTRAPIHLSYEAPAGFDPTDALWLGGNRLLVLNRRFSFLEGFSAKLVMVRLPRLAAGAVLRGEVVTDFSQTSPVDNLEALALGREPSGPVLWIASDDNHMFFQKTLLYRFSIPAEWVSDAPAP